MGTTARASSVRPASAPLSTSGARTPYRHISLASAHACRSGARIRDCQISSGPATHTSGPRVGRTGWAGSGHDRDRDTSSIAPRAPRQPAPGAIESGCWPLVVPLVNSFYTSPGSVSASGPHIGPHRIGGAAAARLPVIHPETAPSPPLRRRPRRMAQRAQARRDVNDPASSGHLWPRTPTAGVSPAWVIGSFLFFLPSRYTHAAPWRRRSPRVCCVKDHVDDAQRPQPRSPTLPPWVGWLGEKASPVGKHLLDDQPPHWMMLL